MANEYSPAWQAAFGVDRDPAQTAREAAFLTRMLPLPAFRRVLDAPCGGGRHARALAAHGYEVAGIDRDPAVIRAAREAAGGPRYAVAKLADLPLPEPPFDALICLWASFGYGDREANDRQLERMARSVRAGGRIVLDLYHGGFFAAGQASRAIEIDGRVIHETRTVANRRLHVRLEYPGGESDDFDWELYEPGDLDVMARRVGCNVVLSCRDWDAKRFADATTPRFQIVLGRV